MSSEENSNYYNIIKKIFDEIDQVILESNERDKNKTNNVEDTYNVKYDQRDKSIVNLVDVNADDELVLCLADDVVTNKQDENDNVYSVEDLPSQETMICDLSDDDEASPKKSKKFTFADSDLPDSDEIEEFLKAYPRPQDTFLPWIETESKSYSDEGSNWSSRRRRKKMKPAAEVTIEKLPERFMTRQRKPNIYLTNTKDCLHVLQSIYLKKQEDQTDEEIIRENIKRLKTSNKNKIPESKDTKSKSFAIKNITLDIISTARTTRYMKNKSDGKNNKTKSISSRNYKNVCRLKRVLNKERTLPTVEERRSKRNQNIEKKDIKKVPESVRKKSAHKQSTAVYNISVSSSESPKSLKRSLVEDGDVPSQKRTRPHNNKVTNASTPVRPKEKTRELEPVKRVSNTPARRGRKAARTRVRHG